MIVHRAAALGRGGASRPASSTRSSRRRTIASRCERSRNSSHPTRLITLRVTSEAVRRIQSRAQARGGEDLIALTYTSAADFKRRRRRLKRRRGGRRVNGATTVCRDGERVSHPPGEGEVSRRPERLSEDARELADDPAAGTSARTRSRRSRPCIDRDPGAEPWRGSSRAPRRPGRRRRPARKAVAEAAEQRHQHDLSRHRPVHVRELRRAGTRCALVAAGEPGERRPRARRRSACSGRPL